MSADERGSARREEPSDRLPEAARGAKAGLWEWELETDVVRLSPAWKMQLGYAPEELPDELATFEAHLHPEDRARVLTQLRSVANHGAAWPLEFRRRHRDGSYRWIQSVASLSVWAGAPRLVGLDIDVTEPKRREHALLESEERLRLAVSGAEVGTWHWNLLTGELVFSERCKSIFGLAPDAPISYARFFELVHPDDRELVDRRVKHAKNEHSEYDLEYRHMWPDGSIRWADAKGRAYYDAQDKPIRMEGVVADVTPRKLAEQALQASEERLRHLTDIVPDMIWQFTPQLELTYANQRYRDYFGRDSIKPSEWGDVIHLDDLPDAQRVLSEILAFPYPEGQVVQRLRCKDGVYRWFRSRFVLVRDAEERPVYIVGASTDIDELKRTEDALREARARLVTALDAGGIGTWRWDLESGVAWDASLARLLGRESDQQERLTLEQALFAAHPEDREKLERALRSALDAGSTVATEFQAVRADGRSLWLSIQGRVEKDAQGRPSRMFGAAVDVTQRKQLEEQLRQAQKMEAIGQLAGGIAHDFNNILMVILGQSSLALLHAGLPVQVVNALRGIHDAAERASGLTAQMLTFGRRQVMRERDLDLNQLVEGLMDMLQRMVGEDVECRFEPRAKAVPIRADSSMLTQVLLNLAVNARAAMPRGGRLTIRTDILAFAAHELAGPYAALWVSDSGVGIASEVLPHIFEPFFTTKEPGSGTGLGLSTVYGIVQQHRGEIHVQTELGQGTTFQITLPLGANVQTAPEPRAVQRAAIAGGGRTILLVEDEQAVRMLQKRALEDRGYRVIAVDTGAAALAAWERHASEISLLLTDVVLPGGMSGLQLAQRLRAEAPALRTILSSGYSSEMFGKSFAFEGWATFLQKPYALAQLLDAVGQALGAATIGSDLS